ncbi:hypothetical protein M0R45_028346 [Rubus argutus]|uniref:SHSP domain-containing protein n=1 Tax=Rubus argutus TaxID=59490 RepID=A0AAW1W7D7_RUBAR
MCMISQQQQWQQYNSLASKGVEFILCVPVMIFGENLLILRGPSRDYSYNEGEPSEITYDVEKYLKRLEHIGGTKENSGEYASDDAQVETDSMEVPTLLKQPVDDCVLLKETRWKKASDSGKPITKKRTAEKSPSTGKESKVYRPSPTEAHAHDSYAAPLSHLNICTRLFIRSSFSVSDSYTNPSRRKKARGTHRYDAVSSSFCPLPPMAFPGPARFGWAGQNNEPDQIDPGKPVLNVAPLNSMPYIPPTMEPSATKDSGEQEKGQPAMVFLPSLSTLEERNKILETNKSGVVLTGVAATGQVGPIIGKVDIGEADDSYLFRVSLPGVSRDENFSCSIEADGENLAPAGHFSVSFHLPGPVDFQQFTGSFETDGVLEGIVKKRI